MSGIVIPISETAGGRAAQPKAFENETGGIVAEFGERMTQVGDALETDRLDREAARSRVDIARELGRARLSFDNASDPDAIDRGWGETAAGLRADLLARADPRNAERLGLAFDELADSHALALGQRAVDLRQGERRAVLADQAYEIVGQAATLDAPTRETLYMQLADAYAQAVDAGTLTAEQAGEGLRAVQDQMGRAAGTRALDADPRALIAAIDAGDYAGADPVWREGLRSRATSAVAAEAARVAAEEKRLATEAAAEIGDRLGNVRDIARAGRVSAFEADLLNDPVVQADPGYPEAAAAVALRDALPDFATLPPADQAAMIEAEQAKPLAEKFELKVLEGMKSAYDAAVAAWEKDPLAQAAALGMEPAPLPPLTAPAGDLTAGLAARRRFGRSLATSGYIERPAFFSAEEREALAAATGPEVDPARRAELAATFARALGSDAPRALAEIEGDELFAHMGSLAAAGGNPAILATAFKGAQALDAKTVELPSEDDRRLWIDEAFGDAIGDERATGLIMRAADAIYAGRARGVANDGGAAARLYATALQEALGGGVNRRGNATGGVQVFRRQLTPLPVGVTGEQVQTAFERAEEQAYADGAAALDLWRRAGVSGGVPHYAGKPIDADVIGRVRLRAEGPGTYSLFILKGDTPMELTDGPGPEKLYTLNLAALLSEVGP